jgi:hypothetical protein
MHGRPSTHSHTHLRLTPSLCANVACTAAAAGGKKPRKAAGSSKAVAANGGAVKAVREKVVSAATVQKWALLSDPTKRHMEDILDRALR